MAVETAVLLFLTFFQLAGAFALAQPRASNAEARRLLAALLVLNATLTGIRALEIEGGAREWLDTTRALVDLPSALLILAVVLALRPEERMRRAAIAVGAISLAHPILAVLAPPLLTNHYTLFFAVPYHLSVAALLWHASKGDGECRWIALAFLPRALYFVVQGIDSLFHVGSPPARDVPHYLVLAGVAVVCAVAIRRLWAAGADSDAPAGPTSTLIVVAAVVGPAIAIAQISFRGTVAPPGIILLDYLTLSLARPAFLYMGLLPGRVGPLAVNSLAAAGVGALVDYSARDLMGFPGPAAALVGFALGLSALAIADSMGSARRQPAAAPPAEPGPTSVEIEEPNPGEARGGDIPHWQRILLELQGSSGHAPAEPADPRWTQKELAARTGISVKRVSEFPQHLNDHADARLDAFLPAWREERKGRPPTLVEVHRGAVRGLAGARVFYSLTPWGERLAAAVAERVRGTYDVGQATTPSSESFSELDGQNAARIADR